MRLLALLLVSSAALAQGVAGGERVEFAAGAEKIFGYLYRPATAGAGKQPAIVIVHGAGGVREVREGFWAHELSAIGVAALVTDSFTPRGVDSTVEDQSRVTTQQMVRDAFGALAYLSRQDFIDGKRIAIMGMSKGGSVALLSADRRTQGGGQAFAAHLPLYPACTAQYRNPQVSAPILMLIGQEDNYTGVKLCAQYAERIRAAGATAQIKLYKGAHHGFDGDTSNEREFFLARAQNYRDCLVFIEDDGKPGPLDRSCIRMGATVAASHRAKMQALEDVRSFLKATILN